MLTMILGAVLIACMRICDVTLDTIRVILVVQGRKYKAGLVGFFEVLIWIFVIRYIMQHMDVLLNLFGYATGFALGNIIGVTVEQKIGLGFVQLNVISRHYTDKIAMALRKSKFGVTILPGEGGTGGVSVMVVIVARKLQSKVIELVEQIDKEAFITVQYSMPFRGFMNGSRK
jgi:uncharacterized protein YebE (UPF0316 family)